MLGKTKDVTIPSLHSLFLKSWEFTLLPFHVLHCFVFQCRRFSTGRMTLELLTAPHTTNCVILALATAARCIDGNVETREKYGLKSWREGQSNDIFGPFKRARVPLFWQLATKRRGAFVNSFMETRRGAISRLKNVCPYFFRLLEMSREQACSQKFPWKRSFIFNFQFKISWIDECCHTSCSFSCICFRIDFLFPWSVLKLWSLLLKIARILHFFDCVDSADRVPLPIDSDRLS